MLADKPLVTIITTVHELEPFIGPCIQSVLDQTYENWEQIVVDDGSTDGTEAVVKQFTDPRIRYMRLSKRGVAGLAESYNTALAAGTGDLVAVLEGDDFWPVNKLELQVSSFENPDIQVVWGDAEVVDQNGRALWHWPRGGRGHPDMTLEQLFRRLTCANIMTPTVTVMVRREALDRIGGFRQPAGALFVDLATWLLVAATSRGKARILPQLLGYYRSHPAQISTEFSFEYFTSQAAVVAAVLREIDPVEFRRLGWSMEQKRKSDASAALARGIANYRVGRVDEARMDCLAALRPIRPLRKTLRALLCLFSTIVRHDLMSKADSMRRKVLVRTH